MFYNILAIVIAGFLSGIIKTGVIIGVMNMKIHMGIDTLYHPTIMCTSLLPDGRAMTRAGQTGLMHGSASVPTETIRVPGLTVDLIHSMIKIIAKGI